MLTTGLFIFNNQSLVIDSQGTKGKMLCENELSKRARETAQRLKAFVTAEQLGLVRSIYTEWLTATYTPAPGNLKISLDLCEHHIHRHKPTHRNTHMPIIKNN